MYGRIIGSYFAVIQAGDLRPYFYRNTDDRIRSIYSVNTAKKFGENTVVNHRPGLQRYGQIRPFTCKIQGKNGCLRLNYVHLRSTIIKHWGSDLLLLLLVFAHYQKSIYYLLMSDPITLLDLISNHMCTLKGRKIKNKNDSKQQK